MGRHLQIEAEAQPSRRALQPRRRRRRLITPVVLTVPVALLGAGIVIIGRGITEDTAITALVPASYTATARRADAASTDRTQPASLSYRERRQASSAGTPSTKPATISALSTRTANTSAPSPAPSASGTTTGGAYTKQVIALANAQRAKAGCGALTENSTLTSVAQGHSADMAARNYFKHADLQGENPFDRMADAGYSYSSAGENIAGGQASPSAVMKAWMRSPGHRANILNCTFTEIGVGFAKGDGTYGTYWTQNLARPLPEVPPTGSISTPTASVPPSQRPSPPATTPPAPAPVTGSPASRPVSTGDFGVGMFMGNFSAASFKSSTGTNAKVESIYYMAKSVTSPRVSQHEAQIDQGISPLIDLSMKQGPYSQAQIAAWGSDVQSYFASFAAGLNTLAQYAASKNNGTHVYFSYEHEAVVKINQNKYISGMQPTIAQSAAAWNKVNAYVASAAPAAVRTYWYGGSGANEDDMASALTPSLIQMATFDPYRWSHNKASDTPSSLWSGMISHLKAQSWMKNADGTLKPWGLSEWGTDATFGDASNAAFVTQAHTFLAEQGAAFAIYFDRVDGKNNWMISSGSQPQTLLAFRATAQAT